MGIIARQGAKSTIVSFVSVVVGVVATAVVYTLDLDAYGLSRILLAASVLLAPFASLGVSGLIVRFFPEFRAEAGGRAAFLTALLAVAGIGAVLLGLVGYFFGLPLLAARVSDANRLAVYVDHAGAIYWLTVLTLFAGVIDGYIQNFYRITVQTVINNLLPKFFLAAIIYLSYHQDWSGDTLANALIAMRATVLLLLLAYLWRLGELRLSTRIGRFLTPDLRRRMLTYAGYGIIGSIGGKVALEIDTVSLGAYVTEAEVGVYSILIFAASVITIPYYAIGRIASPILTEALDRDDLAKVEDIYQRSSVILGFVGALIFTLIFVSLVDVIAVIDRGRAEAFAGGLAVFAMIGGAKLVDLLASVNSQIISFSRLYRFNLVMIVVLAVLNTGLNYLFIARYGMGLRGAALASLIALVLFNLLKGGYVYWQLRIQPLRPEAVFPLLLGLVCCVLGWLLPLPFHPVVNVVLRSGLVAALFLGYVLFTPHLPELREGLVGLVRRLRGRRG